MTVRREGEGWLADFYENGQDGRRICKSGFASREDAERYEADFIALRQMTGIPLDERLSDLVELWCDRRGRFLRKPEWRLLRLRGTVKRLGNPRVSEFTAESWERYEHTRRTQVVPSLIRQERNCLSTVYADLIHFDFWLGKNPFAECREAGNGGSEPDNIFLRRTRERSAEIEALVCALPARHCTAQYGE
ncbi:Arm DNA-binding domain-containing protein [Pseudomonas sp. LFM046]|uniref:phage integrase n=1 Tax=Pseudomonas sp. LFM046 TaxID=1608357 RepID=UPI000697C7BB|nr:Arm DNA-binding domain-containing protein [Pseudomonas sp. LFM046]